MFIPNLICYFLFYHIGLRHGEKLDSAISEKLSLSLMLTDKILPSLDLDYLLKNAYSPSSASQNLKRVPKVFKPTN